MALGTGTNKINNLVRLLKLIPFHNSLFYLYTLHFKILKCEFSDLTTLNILVLIWKEKYKCGKYVIKYIIVLKN